MELSFTQGRWNYEKWGGFDPISSNNAKPPGVELWAVFDVPQDQVDASWRNLTHTLSGLFCASINFLESSTMYSAPQWSFRPATGNIRYGMLPREAVCTENLTPWLKLLPCRDKAGISALMDRPSIYRSFYHSQRLHLISNKSGPEGMNPGIVLEQALTVVLQPNSQRTGMTFSGEKNVQPSWSLSSILVSNIFAPIISFGSSIDQEREEFYEELLLRPLPDRKVLAHFHFQSTAPPSNSNGRHHHLFPKAISQLVLVLSFFNILFFCLAAEKI